MLKVVASLYEIIRPLGFGSGGAVYLGRHLRLDKYVVLKAYTGSFSANTVTALKHEADTLKNLSHSHIPQIYDFVAEDDIVYMVMDYIEGESLEKALERGERFGTPEIVAWAKQVLSALIYLHSRPPFGILHSDIKPANLMLTSQGDIRLIDFNIALALGESGALSVGRSQGYASPEHYGLEYTPADLPQPKNKTNPAKADAASQVKTEITPLVADGRQAIELDARSDIFGLGATLYHLLTGRKPQPNALEVIPLSAADCPPGLAVIINKAMSPCRCLRFQSAQEMLTALQNIHQHDPRARLFKRLCLGAAALAAVILVAGLLFSFAGLKRREAANNAAALTQASASALLKGDRASAVDLALQAVPAKSGLFRPPLLAATQKALTEALGVYDLAADYQPYKSLTLPSAPLMAAVSPQGKTAAIVYAYEAAVVDLASGRTLFRVPLAESALAEARFVDETTLICAAQDGLGAYNVATGEQLWRAAPATALAIAAAGQTIAAYNRNDTFAIVYDVSGQVLAKVDFEGKTQRAPLNDSFVNPRDNLFALSAGGRFLAVSFADGSLSVFDLQDAAKRFDIESDFAGYLSYEGGFCEDLLAFAANGEAGSQMSVIDMTALEQLGGFSVAGRLNVVAGEQGIFISSGNLLVQLDPVSGAQQELAFTEADIQAFAINNGYALAALQNGQVIMAQNGREVYRSSGDFSRDITLLAGEYALLGGRDQAEMTILRLQQPNRSQLLSFDAAYHYLEARVNGDGSRFMLFSPDGFRLYDSNGALIKEQAIPDASRVYNQQYAKTSGNLAVIYPDAVAFYSGRDGALIFEQSGLRSVFYAPYGLSILEADGRLRLLDLDNGAEIFSTPNGADTTFAAYCGLVVDDAFLAGRRLIGAAQVGQNYVFAVTDGAKATLYEGTGQKLWDASLSGPAEAFFTSTAVILSPLHGRPGVYNLKNGQKIADLEKDAYLTYLTELGDYIVSQYLTSAGQHFGLLLNSSFEPIASLPRLCDIWQGQLVFDYPQGVLRRSRVYDLEELVEMAQTQSRAVPSIFVK